MFGGFELSESTISVIAEIGGHMPGGFFIYKAAGPEELIYANKAVFDIFGCSGEEEFRELTGYTFKGMVHPDDYERISSSIVQQIKTSEDQMDYAEYRIIRKDGEVRWVDDYGHYCETRAYGGIYVVFISDITEKREQLEVDKATRDAVISTLTNAYNTVWLINDVVTERCSLYHTDMDEVHAEAIKNALSHARYTDTKTQYVATMVAEEDQERMQEEIGLPYILEQFETRDQFSVDFIRALPTGPRHYRVDFGKVHMPGGRIGAMMGFKDVDDEIRQAQAVQKALDDEARAKQRELEEKLALQERLIKQERQQKELNSMITAMASDYRSVYHVDIDADDAVCYRADPGDPKQTPEGVHFPYRDRFSEYCELYVDKDYKEGFLHFIDPDNVRAVLATESIMAYRYLAHRNGEEYYEMLRMAGVRHPADRDDNIVHAVGLGFTVIDAEMRETLAKNHDLAEALSIAEDASKAKTAFLSNMSHEIRTPLNAIIGLDSIALNDSTISETTRDYLEKIGVSAHHLLGIINDILDMSRIESGRMVIKSEEFSFAKALSQVNTIISGQCKDKGLAYECRIKGNVEDYYIGDDMKLRQVMINILGNAVKFTPEGGSVSFTVEELARFDGRSVLRFIISDTGIGMSRDYLPRLFDPFTQEDSSSTSRYGSTGLGMPITKSIIELMNGHIDVESEKGKGTTFTVTITLLDSDRKAEADEGVLNTHDMCVLVIDDDPIACDHAQLILGQVGISCEKALSGAEGLEMVKLRYARREPYNLILVDWKMPELDGVETTRLIRAEVGIETPIIILTSFSWDEIENEAREAGVDSFVAKPLFVGSVLDEFRETFKKKNERLLNETADLEGRRILLAEDVAVNTEIMKMVLSMREMTVEHAENGKLAVDMFAGHEPGYYDAILMDMRMPVMDGLEATRTIRAMDRKDAKTIPIIAMTANAFDEDVQRSMQAGLNAHLSKPVEPEALFRTLESLIKP